MLPFTMLTPRNFTRVGAYAALALYFAVGLIPAQQFGGYAGILLAQGIFGTPVRSTLPVHALVLFGRLLGAVGVSGLFAVGGAIVGAAAWGVAKPFLRRAPLHEEG